MKTNKKKKRILLIVLLIFIISLVASFFIYFSIYYKNTNNSALDNTNEVQVKEYDNGYLFDGSGSETLFIFYQGAKIEDIAYGDLLKRIASKGIDCFLISSPFNFALFSINEANKVIDSFSYNCYYVGGHSLGGTTSCLYAYKNSDKIDGIILLGAYSSKDLSNTNLNFLSIYGDLDNILNMDNYSDNIKNLPSNYKEVIITGGNHSNFGTYGLQKKDKESLIDGDNQREKVSEEIYKFINNL